MPLNFYREKTENEKLSGLIHSVLHYCASTRQKLAEEVVRKRYVKWRKLSDWLREEPDNPWAKYWYDFIRAHQ